MGQQCRWIECSLHEPAHIVSILTRSLARSCCTEGVTGSEPLCFTHGQTALAGQGLCATPQAPCGEERTSLPTVPTA